AGGRRFAVGDFVGEFIGLVLVADAGRVGEGPVRVNRDAAAAGGGDGFRHDAERVAGVFVGVVGARHVAAHPAKGDVRTGDDVAEHGGRVAGRAGVGVGDSFRRVVDVDDRDRQFLLEGFAAAVGGADADRVARFGLEVEAFFGFQFVARDFEAAVVGRAFAR